MAIEVRGVGKRFTKRGGAAGETFAALKDVDLTVPDHEFISLLGASGCGKTTLLKMVDGLVPPDEGEIRVDGRVVTGPGPDRAMVFQEAALLPWTDVLTNVAFGLELRGVPRAEREARARRIVAAVGLSGFEKAYPHQLSGGMQQRAGLARALVVEPRTVLMDEPFGAVDALTRQVLQEELLDLWQAQRMTVLFVTHSIEEAVFLSDRVALFTPRPGRIAEVVDVGLTRPRTLEEVRQTPEYAELTSYLWDVLKRLLSLPAHEDKLRLAEGA